jgi:hypothetical protein
MLPVPGGFGILEVGLAGTLILYGAPATQAAAAVVVYHAIAFWVPSLGGLIGYARLRRRLTRDVTPTSTESDPLATGDGLAEMRLAGRVKPSASPWRPQGVPR